MNSKELFLEFVWKPSAHLRVVSPIMALLTATFMYPEFFADLWHDRIFNMAAFNNFTTASIAWMGMALLIQSLHSSSAHPYSFFAHPVYAILGVAMWFAFMPLQALGLSTIPFAIAIWMYEGGFHVRQHLWEELPEHRDGVYISHIGLFQAIRQALTFVSLAIIGGIASALAIAGSHGHLF